MASNQVYDPVPPGIFLAWAKRIGIEVPHELIQRVEAHGVVIGDWKDAYDNLKVAYDKLKDGFDSLLEDYKEKTELAKERHDLTEELEKLKQRLPLTADSSGSETDNDLIARSAYLRKFFQLAVKAVNDFPGWLDQQKVVQRTGNLMDWLTAEIGATSREAEIIKKVLSEIFPRLL
ncbi:MAG: hypothetical protein ACU836_18555 [Gammaproteobacteria bacterium]